jgi:excisionase family DNA binding protein
MEKGPTVNTDKNPETQFTNVGGAAKILAVHPNTIRNMITANALPAYHYGARCIRIRIDDVVKVLNRLDVNEQR